MLALLTNLISVVIRENNPRTEERKLRDINLVPWYTGCREAENQAGGYEFEMFAICRLQKGQQD